ncbi:MAG: penicillin acylase family protein, partial [Candidatus Hydrogenedentes bacterium]|nr:penicillin acylase family protein [Candidatus Hydrogenedentota bacterium]
MRRMRRIVQFLFVLTMLLIVVGAGVVVYWAYVRQPQLDGTASVAEVTAKVRVVRDDWGVPHIAAENEADAYFALGYVMAQDRLFQMDLARRVAGGMLAEVFGAKAVPVDSVVRSFRLRPKAEETLAKMAGAYPALKAVTDAFVAGINACIEREPLPFEFAVLAYTPEPFTPVDCLSVGALLPITFADGLREDPLATMIQQKHPELDIRLLFPGYDRETPVTVMESIEEA